VSQNRDAVREAGRPLKDDQVCPDCGHFGRRHFWDPELAKRDGCMVPVDSAYTVTNARQCGCRRRRAFSNG
jgi:hypothetical protein